MNPAQFYSGIVIVLGLLAGGTARAQPDPAAPARTTFASCAGVAISHVIKLRGLTATGQAYLVGLACAGAREQYKKALIQYEPAINVDKALSLADAEIIQVILDYSSHS